MTWLLLLALPVMAQVPTLGQAGEVKLGPPAGFKAAQSAAKSVKLSGFASSWAQDCSEDCGIPVGVVKNQPLAAELGLPEKAGEFRMVSFVKRFAFEGLGELTMKTAVYAICPRGGTPTESDPCPGRYFQVQMELSGLAGAVCGSMVNAGDVEPFPVLTCGAPAGTRKVGITLHRIPL
ncbi:MAG TPA: hypothetical protein DCM05_01300 [Elusimicrobia bacterium]|nr:hypothetical protein [Elusimicrobiota bacterium]